MIGFQYYSLALETKPPPEISLRKARSGVEFCPSSYSNYEYLDIVLFSHQYYKSYCDTPPTVP